MNLISARDGHFHDNGAIFKIVGANNYYLAFATTLMRRAVIAAAQRMGLSVLRAPAFLDCKPAHPGTIPEGAWRGVYFQYWNLESNRLELNTGENGIERLDRLIADAEQAGIRLILPLVNHWPDFGGMDQYVAWFNGSCREDFYRNPNIREAYQSYAGQILTRKNSVTGRLYKNEPAILAWELANEPRCDTRDGRDVVLTWVTEMSRFIKQTDPHHLLAIGDEGFFATASGALYYGRHGGRHGCDCDAFLRVPDIDFGTFHMYPQAWKQRDPLRFGLRWISEHLAAGRNAGKPMLLEEYGMRAGRPERDSIYRAWLDSIREQDGAGDLAWMLASTDDETGEPYQDFDQFTFYSETDVPSIRAHAMQMTAQNAA